MHESKALSHVIKYNTTQPYLDESVPSEYEEDNGQLRAGTERLRRSARFAHGRCPLARRKDFDRKHLFL